MTNSRTALGIILEDTIHKINDVKAIQGEIVTMIVCLLATVSPIGDSQEIGSKFIDDIYKVIKKYETQHVNSM